MDKDLKLSPAGLWTSPSVAEAPKGGLLEADEIVIRRKGMAEPRPGFSRSTDLVAMMAAASIVTPVHMIDYGSKYYVIGRKSDTSKYGIANSSSQAVTEDSTGRSDEAIFDIGTADAIEVRKNLYWNTNDGPRKLSANTETSLLLAGVGATWIEVTSTATAGDAIEAGKYVAYSALVKREDANGVVFRGYPSGRSIATAAGATRKAALRVYLHKTGHVRVGDTIEVYRTLNETTVPPSNEMYLVGSVVVVSGDLVTGYIALTDNTPDAETGQTLYTSPSEEGTEAGHNRPPAARCMEYFNGSLFLGRLKYPAAQTFTYSPVLTGFAATGQIGARVMTATFVNGSANVTVADSSLFKVGQIIVDSGSDWNSGTTYTRITALTDATHIAFNHTWAGSTGADQRPVVDSIRINSSYFPVYTPRVLVAGIKGTDVYPMSQQASQTASTAVDIELLSDNNTAISLSSQGRILFRLQALNAWDTAPVIYATNGAAYEPPLPEPTATGYSLPVETIEEGLAWSNFLEPEHFTAVNIERAGMSGKNVLAMKAIKNALIVLKEDGVYRVSGANADSGFRIDELQKGCQLLHPYACVATEDKVYAWCDQGFYELDENGAEDISSAALSDILHPLELEIGVGNYDATGAWVIHNRKDNEIGLSVPASGALNAGAALFVFNREQGAWTKWLTGQALWHGLYRSTDKLLRLWTSGPSANDALRTERSENATIHTVDGSYTVTISAVSGTAVTITGGSGWTPAEGDLFVKSGSYMVTAITDATHFTVHKSGLTTGSGTAYESYQSKVTPIGYVASGPQDMKTWGEVSALWNSLKGVLKYTLGYTSSLGATEVTATRTVSDDLVTSTKPVSLRHVTPRRHARADRVYPSVQVKQAGATWALEGLSLNVQISGDRLRNRK